jgi:hypothetical protein
MRAPWPARARRCQPSNALGSIERHDSRLLSVGNVDGVKIFYREANRQDALTSVQLHAFADLVVHVSRDPILRLTPHPHVLAPDYPNYGYVLDAPARSRYTNAIDHLAQTPPTARVGSALHAGAKWCDCDHFGELTSLQGIHAMRHPNSEEPI